MAGPRLSSSSKKPALGHNKEPVPATPPPTDFGELDVLASAPVPATAVEVCHADGFSLNSGVRIGGGDGALLVGGEAFVWRPWEAGDGDGRRGEKGKGRRRLVNDKGQWEVAEEIRPLSPATRRAISNLGMRVEVLDTRNAASQYNMLATERGVEDVAAALIPIGWKEGAE
ncbi:hypothetical protein NEMBOFW57_000221 [Staphylotrichum longicolle]|uniref:Uncharacterized protein n=1 Tax=Staphylotrichum longicolle TaxID=669026 RepID=A0AAD4I2R1_9PEZI|nr:hypothetical protein NEMBOFW57_000221 [Staphylotrichum longicolle]